MKITGKTQQLAVIGDPADHSFSPVMHNFISGYMGKDYTYSAFTVKSENLGDAISGMRAMGFRGMNVTAPHKIEVMQYLDEISPEAKLLGSVNTIVNNNGHLIGYNTDSEGFYMSLQNAGIPTENKDILVMGCGGVVIPALVRIIKSNPKSITLVNRTKSKAEKLAKNIFDITGFGIKTTVENDTFDLIINTTSAGMGKQIDTLPWDSIPELSGTDFITEKSSAVDMIYNPERTKFLKLAEEKGAKVINGLDMLIYQGILAYELFTDTKLPDNIAELLRKEVFGL
ncbi:MAG: shikimate dehydrogenase [Clostridia bacterium]|nr:shikimate dehydrogenase [Clostridia bacterium]